MEISKEKKKNSEAKPKFFVNFTNFKFFFKYYEEHESDFNEETTLNAIYDLVKHKIPVVNEPLLELDRNARKFEQFIQSCEPPLTAMILKKILPCTCNLDPYLIKLIKGKTFN